MTRKKPKNLVELAQEINGYSSEEREQAILELLKYVRNHEERKDVCFVCQKDHPERKPSDAPFYV